MEYVEQIAKVVGVELGWEDHGIFTCMVHLDYGGCASQGAGGYALDAPQHDQDRRTGTQYGMEWIIRLMRACGVNDFADLKGRTVIALRGEGFQGQVHGFKPLPTEPGEPFIFNELAKEYEDAHV
jgi:hypothetical protein